VTMSGTILIGDALEQLRALPGCSVHCCVTSPPYWGLRDYGCEGQMGLEPTPDAYVQRMVEVFGEVRRVLRGDGTLWLNVGDSYSQVATARGKTYQRHSDVRSQGWEGTRLQKRDIGRELVAPKTNGDLKPKDLVGIPWRLAFALQTDGWYLRSDIVWAKPNPMPESVTDRPTKSHEHVFMLSKQPRYYWDQDAVREPHSAPGVKVKPWQDRPNNGSQSGPPGRYCMGYGESGRNLRDVWTIATEPCREAHFAVMPQKLVEPCVKAGCPVGGTVLDPFFGAGTVGVVADRLGRGWIGIELNPEYAEMARRRIADPEPLPVVESDPQDQLRLEV
jgi:DNA modification methylase